MKHNIRINGSVKEIDCDIATGLRDKNGKKIFTGDKVRYWDGYTPLSGTVTLIEGEFVIEEGWSNALALLTFFDRHKKTEEIEIVTD